MSDIVSNYDFARNYSLLCIRQYLTEAMSSNSLSAEQVTENAKYTSSAAFYLVFEGESSNIVDYLLIGVGAGISAVIWPQYYRNVREYLGLMCPD